MQIMEIDGKRLVRFNRVMYGKLETLPEKREYRIAGMSQSPVGTRKEIEEWIRDKTSFDGFVLVDRTEGFIGFVERSKDAKEGDGSF